MLNILLNVWKRKVKKQLLKMALHILKCPKCKEYSLSENCPKCNKKTSSSIPAKYSPEDSYGKYRRKAKEEDLKKKGLL